LKDVFKKVYDFEVVSCEIQNDGKLAHNQVMKFMTDFVDQYDDKDTLFIIYYAGHGWINQVSKRLELAG